MRWQYLALIALVAALAAWSSRAATTEAVQANGAVAVDCDAAAAGVQNTCSYANGSTFNVQVHVTKAPTSGYFAYQTKVRWSDPLIEYVPASISTENKWPHCTFPARHDNQPGDPSVLHGCVPSPMPSVGFTTTGAVVQLQLRCQQQGLTALTLVPRAGDAQLGTHLLDQVGQPFDPVLANATVNCGSVQPYGVGWGSHNTPGMVGANSVVPVLVTFTNAGSLTWPAAGDGAVQLSYHWSSGACPWGTTVVWNGLRVSLPADVASGETVSAQPIGVQVPSAPGQYCLVYDLVQGASTWFSQQGAAALRVPVTVQGPKVSWGSHTTPGTVTSNSLVPVNVTFTNTGLGTWLATGSGAVKLSYHWSSGACPWGTTAVWNGRRVSLPEDVSNGETVNGLPISVQVPSAPGQYCLVYDLVQGASTWFSQQGAAALRVPVTVQEPPYAVSWGSHTTPGAMTASSQVPVTVTFTNTGSLVWPAAGGSAVQLSYHWSSGACPWGTTLVWNGPRAALTDNVTNGETVSALPIQVQAPSAPGQYCLVYDLVQGPSTWFSQQAAAVLRIPVTVN
ncbi:MAG: hypothetical protein WEE64_03550 [Dehalococcoidia bacterium]